MQTVKIRPRDYYIPYMLDGKRLNDISFIPEFNDMPDVFAKKDTWESTQSVSVNGLRLDLTEKREVIIVYIHLKMFCGEDYDVDKIKDIPETIDFKDYGYDIKVL